MENRTEEVWEGGGGASTEQTNQYCSEWGGGVSCCCTHRQPEAWKVELTEETEEAFARMSTRGQEGEGQRTEVGAAVIFG